MFTSKENLVAQTMFDIFDFASELYVMYARFKKINVG